jgi:ribosomal-protein-alanine N-acetyltransferase
MRISKGFIYLVAVVNGIVVGFADVRLMKEKAKIMGIAVEDKFQYSGVGSTLINNVVELARAEGKKLVYLEVRRDNLPAIKLYERYGFTLEKEFEKGGDTFYIMCRRLET